MENIVKKLRGNLSQAELAKKAGMPQRTIAGYELGRFPNPDKLDKIAAAVGKKVKWIIENIEAIDTEGEHKQMNRERQGERRQADRRNMQQKEMNNVQIQH